MRTYTEGEIIEVLRRRFRLDDGRSQTEVAAEIGFSVQYIQAVLGGSRSVSGNLALALGFEKRPDSYVRVK